MERHNIIFMVSYQPPNFDKPTYYYGNIETNGDIVWDFPISEIPNYVIGKIASFVDTYNNDFTEVDKGKRIPLAVCIGVTILEEIK